ncbi:hypothetical protein T265_00448 [Opisthorchis viverrini]|uniref:Uncharacterized protein n=1 Tax=Opisthorchis viverrini TaxID=6198 RepID=A0A075AJQ1_OPIVI|nr:hypothetical protein T265_00448 [Opisthorchis viverrini]KER33774.1 hypothetical protein T265_00448 [Opisthorchis viverrini]
MHKGKVRPGMRSSKPSLIVRMKASNTKATKMYWFNQWSRKLEERKIQRACLCNQSTVIQNIRLGDRDRCTLLNPSSGKKFIRTHLLIADF